jgi:hypothetical protein
MSIAPVVGQLRESARSAPAGLRPGFLLASELPHLRDLIHGEVPGIDRYAARRQIMAADFRPVIPVSGGDDQPDANRASDTVSYPAEAVTGSRSVPPGAAA